MRKKPTPAPAKTSAKAPVKTAFDPNKAITDMMEIIDTLRNIYAQETSALNVADSKTFLALQDAKLQTARKYQHSIEAIMERRDEMRSMNPRLKERLKATYGDFTALASKNIDALQRMQRCTGRLGETLMNAARDAAKKQRTVAYSESGLIRGAHKKGVSMGVSETA